MNDSHWDPCSGSCPLRWCEACRQQHCDWHERCPRQAPEGGDRIFLSGPRPRIERILKKPQEAS